MPTLAQQFKEEFREEFIETLGPKLKKEGEKKEKYDTARRMLMDDFSLEKVMKYTGLTEKEIKSLMN